MSAITLSDGDREVLIEVVEGHLSELRMEIADTDSSEFKERLRGRKETLQRILHALQPEH